MEESENPRSGSPPELPQLRDVSDARTLRALAHPARIALIELLTIEGPQTATEAGARIGESPSNCSFHLRELAKHGFVEEAGGGRGRARPWKMARIGMRWSSRDADAETAIAADAVFRLVRERQLARYEAWLATRSAFPADWQDAAIDNEHLFWLTAEEFAELQRRLTELLLPLHRERLADPAARPPGALPVELLTLGFPIVPPPPPPAPDNG